MKQVEIYALLQLEDSELAEKIEEIRCYTLALFVVIKRPQLKWLICPLFVETARRHKFAALTNALRECGFSENHIAMEEKRIWSVEAMH